MIYVMSDIHGNSRRFNSIMVQINLQPEDTLYVLGDVIDRHGDGIRILRRLMAMPNAHLLLGNHEYMMLRALGEPFEPEDDLGRIQEFRFHWYRNGGEVTHKYWKRIRKTLRAEVLAYLKALPLELSVQVGDRKFRLVHGSLPTCFNTEGGKYKTPIHYAVWKRLEKGDRPAAGETVIFGHTPTKYYASTDPLRIYHGDGIIGIDCGSGYPDVPEDVFDLQGRLACLRLDDMQEFYSEENGKNTDFSPDNQH